MEILNAFGLDIKLLIANLINFLILVGVLYAIGYKPILRFVKQRQEKIEKGVHNAAAAARQLEQARIEQEEIVKQAHKEGQRIIKKAQEQARAQSDAIIAKTKEETKLIVDRAKKEIRLEQEQAIGAAKKEVAHMVLFATEKLLKTKLDAKKDTAFIKAQLKEL